MATLSEGLEWILKANNTQLKKGIDEGKEKVKELDKQTKKSTDAMGKGFLQVKESVEKVKGALIFYAAAVAALITPTLKAEQSLRKLSAASLLAGQSMDKGKMIDSVKRAADAMGTTYSAAASKAAAAVSGFGTNVNSASKLIVESSKMAKLGLADEASAMEALGSAAKAFKQDVGTFAESFGSKFAVAAASSGESVMALAGAVSSVARPAMEANVNISALIAAMSGLVKGGMSLAESQSIVESVLKSSINPTQEQAAAWQQLGLFQGQSLVSGEALIGTLGYLISRAKDSASAVGTLTGSTEELVTAFGKTDGAQMADMFAQMAGAAQVQAAALTESKSTLDKISEGIAQLVNAVTPLSESWQQLAATAERIAAAFGMVWDFVSKIVSSGIDQFINFASGIGSGLAGFASGGSVPGQGSGDTVPAMLTPGEFVVKKSVAQRARGFLSALNNGMVRGYAFGGTASAWGGSSWGMGTFGAAPSYSNPYARGAYGGGSPLLGRGSPLLGSSGFGTLLGRGSPLLGALNPWAMGFGSSYATRYAPLAGNSYYGARRYANGGEVSSSTKQSAIPQSGPVGSSYSIGSMSLNFPNARISPTVVRDQILPAISRESEGGRNRRARTRL